MEGIGYGGGGFVGVPAQFLGAGELSLARTDWDVCLYVVRAR